MSEFEEWLRTLGLEQHLQVLTRHDVDLDVAPDLTDADLERLGLSLGHRRKFRAAAIRRRPAGPVAADAAPATPDPASAAARVERRQVTVVFADLVDSTALSQALDPEDMQRLLDRYRDTCAAIVARHDGHVAQYLGDGILAYFGYPLALEDAAERAIRAALEVTHGVAAIARPDGRPLQARLGIATGLVVAAGAADDAERTVVGDTPNLAARLQGCAAPGSVLVSESTRRLAGDFFEFSGPVECAAKGYASAQAGWTVLRERGRQTRFAAAHASSTAPLVGRERERAFLLDSWARARAGNGHLILVSGEAGMGKSRLLEAVAEQAHDDGGALLLRCQCSPYHRNSALYPFAQMLRHALGIDVEGTAAERLGRVDALLARLRHAGKAGRVLLADLLEIGSDETLSAIEMTAAQRKSQTLAIVEAFIVEPGAAQASLLLVEDAHWIDPTSAALLERLLARIEQERLLVVVTHRPEWEPGWNRQPSVSSLLCRPLGRGPSAELVRALSAEHGIDEAKVREIVQRSDGVPLFAEELTKAVLELQPGQDAQIPATLRDSLMARLDRLGGAKSVAQIAAVIGREFDFATLQAVAGLPAAALDEAVQRLLRSGLVVDVGRREGRQLGFHHALVQEEAYESLSKARRVELHRRVAAELERAAPGATEAAPELIAHHHARAGDALRAFDGWLRAAERARERCAFAEALAQLQAALGEAARIPDAASAAHAALRAQLQIGATLLQQRGPQAEPVEQAMSRARTMAQASGAGAELFQATWGLYLHAASNLDFERARRHGDDLTAISERLGDDGLHMEALHHRWGIAYFSGDTPRMLERTAAAFDRYDAKRHHPLAHVFGGHDLGVCAHCVHSIGSALDGRPERARVHAAAALALAESLEHPVSVAFALGNASVAHWIAGDIDGAAALAERLSTVATRYELAAQRGLGGFMLGLYAARRGRAQAGADEAQGHYDAASSQGFLSVFPAITLADALARAGRRDAALTLLNRTLERLPAPQSGVYVPELWRQRGELVAAADGASSAAAESDLRIALRIAVAQQGGVFRLRATIALARLLAAAGRRGESEALLAGADASGLDPEVEEIGLLRALAADLDAPTG